MDCIDCHTRPAHNFLSPDEAVDDAITAGLLERSVPWLKSNLVAVLVRPYKTTDGAMQNIASSLRASYPKLASIDGLVTAAQQIYGANFFPEMKTDWRVHPDNIGHKISAGCFRCHDGNHVSASGQVISKDCNSCHTLAAQQEGKEELAAIPNQSFKHPIDLGDLTAVNCSDCHTGGSAP